MDEEAEQQLTAQLSGGGEGQQQQQLDATTASASPASHQQRRSLASLLSIKREPRRPKTPSVVVTDETTHLVSVEIIIKVNQNHDTSFSFSQSELTAIPVTSRISLSFKNKSNKGAATSAATSCTSPAGSCGGGGGDGHHASGSRTTAMAVNGGTLESIVALESADPVAAATTATASDVTTSLTVPVDGEKEFPLFLIFLI